MYLRIRMDIRFFSLILGLTLSSWAHAIAPFAPYQPTDEELQATAVEKAFELAAERMSLEELQKTELTFDDVQEKDPGTRNGVPVRRFEVSMNSGKFRFMIEHDGAIEFETLYSEAVTAPEKVPYGKNCALKLARASLFYTLDGKDLQDLKKARVKIMQVSEVIDKNQAVTPDRKIYLTSLQNGDEEVLHFSITINPADCKFHDSYFGDPEDGLSS